MAASRPGSSLSAVKEPLRNGYGHYVYPNSFFQYEGEWKEGKKHGYGKLLFKDGSYYEGEFVDGEITGNGFRYWASTGNTYSGQFFFGELHGHGVIQYKDSGKYEGEFAYGIREGHGFLTDKDGQTYEGCFHKNKRHGVGKMIFKNGDEYEGDWILDQRQGHGVLHCADGTVYEGQWRNDTFNGQGSVLHCSGVTYDGLWLNGYPVGQAKKIVILGPDVMDAVPGSAHTFHVQLQNEEGEVSERENGRLLEISAGVRHRPLPANCENSLFKIIEQYRRGPIKRSFGFEYISYPLMESVSGSQELQAALPTVGKSGFTLPELPVPEGDTKPESGSKSLDGAGDAPSNWDVMKKDSCHFARFQRAERGRAVFRNVSLAPPPGDPQPAVHSEEPHEEGGDQTSAKAPAEQTAAFQATVGDGRGCLKDGMELMVSLMAQSYPAPACGTTDTASAASCGPAGDESSPERSSANRSPANFWGPRGHECCELFMCCRCARQLHEKSSQYRPSEAAERSEPRTTAPNPLDFARALPGEYIIMVHEVTSPPFLGQHLLPAFVVLRVLPEEGEGLDFRTETQIDKK